MTTTIAPTAEQQAAIDHWLADNSVALNAPAGSGKTVTTIMAMRARQEQCPNETVLATSFTNKVVAHLENSMSLAGIAGKATNIHKIGFQAIKNWDQIKGNARVDKWKYWDIARDIVEKTGDNELDREIARSLVDLAHYAMMTLTPARDEKKVLEMARKYGLLEDFIKYVPQVIDRGMDLVKEGKIHFDDQLYAVWYYDLDVPEYDVVYVDEIQSLSPLQQYIALKSSVKGLYWVSGDVKQSIYGFAGADLKSFERAAKSVNAETFTITRSWRFGENIASKSTKIVPYLVGGNESSDDIVETLAHLPTKLDNTCAVLARTNRVLIDLAFQLYRRGVKVRLAARNIDRDIESFIEKAQARVQGEDMLTTISRYASMVLAKLQGRVSPYQIEEIKSKRDTVIQVITLSNATNFQELVREVKEILANQHGPTLITAHSAQGLEWPRVYVLEGTFVKKEEKDNSTPDEQEAERQLKYVARTRPIHYLGLVKTEAVEPESDEAIKQRKVDEMRKKMEAMGLTLEDLQ